MVVDVVPAVGDRASRVDGTTVHEPPTNTRLLPSKTRPRNAQEDRDAGESRAAGVMQTDTKRTTYGRTL